MPACRANHPDPVGFRPSRGIRRLWGVALPRRMWLNLAGDAGSGVRSSFGICILQQLHPTGNIQQEQFPPLTFYKENGVLDHDSGVPSSSQPLRGFLESWIWKLGWQPGAFQGDANDCQHVFLCCNIGGKRREGSRLSVFPPQWKVLSALLLTFLLPMKCWWRDFFQEGHFPPACALLGGAPGVSVGSTGQRGASVS